MLSKRANIFYLERCKVMQRNEAVVYLTDTGQEIERYFNIPDKNTLFILLGTGTSITNAAIRKLSESNVVIGFCGGGGSPLAASVDATFILPQDEYRPTEYAQAWFEKWMSDEKRLELGKALLRKRIEWTTKAWRHNGVEIPDQLVDEIYSVKESSRTTTDILLAEAQWAKKLYAILAKHHAISFSRKEGQGLSEDAPQTINRLIDHGNYLAYGYAAIVLHGLGIPFSLPILHGKTRRGGLVFDIADLVKDQLVLPTAFEMGSEGSTKKLDRKFRGSIIESADSGNMVDHLFDTVRELAIKNL
jgi:CRISPR-associated protein Cas1